MMINTARSVSEYFERLEGDRREALLRLRKLIKQIWPNAVEDMRQDMPTYHLGGFMLCSIANQKHFMALYIMPYDLLIVFKKDLLIYDRGRSCIRFKRLEPATFDLFDRIIKYTGNQLEESELLPTLASGKSARHR